MCYCIGQIHLQFGVLDGQAASGGASTIDQDPFVALALTRERQAELLVKCQADGDDANASSGSLFERKVVRDLVGSALLHESILGKAAAVEVVCIGAVCHTSNAVAGLVTLGDF